MFLIWLPKTLIEALHGLPKDVGCWAASRSFSRQSRREIIAAWCIIGTAWAIYCCGEACTVAGSVSNAGIDTASDTALYLPLAKE